MNKLVLLLLLFCCLLTGCEDAQETVPSTQASPETTAAAAIVSPLPVTIDIARLDNCTVAISLEEGDAYVDDTGVMQMHVTVYTYDLYDMVDVARLNVGDIIVIRNQEIGITSIDRPDHGGIVINGGLDVGGYELRTEEDTVFYEIGYSDVKSWYSIGEATIRVSPDFQYTDRSDPDREPILYYPGDFLIEGTGIDYHFTPHNTTITIADGKIIAMERIYTP